MKMLLLAVVFMCAAGQSSAVAYSGVTTGKYLRGCDGEAVAWCVGYTQAVMEVAIASGGLGEDCRGVPTDVAIEVTRTTAGPVRDDAIMGAPARLIIVLAVKERYGC